MSLLAKCVSLLGILKFYGNPDGIWWGGGSLNLKILRGGGPQAGLEIWMERRGGKCLPSGVRGVGDFSGITHCHSMFGFVGNFSLT